MAVLCLQHVVLLAAIDQCRFIKSQEVTDQFDYLERVVIGLMQGPFR